MARLIFTAYAFGESDLTPHFADIRLSEEDIERLQKAGIAVTEGGLRKGVISISSPSFWGIPKSLETAAGSETHFEDRVQLEDGVCIIRPPIGKFRDATICFGISEKHSGAGYQSCSVSLDDLIEAARSSEPVIFFEEGEKASRERLEALIQEALDEECLS